MARDPDHRRGWTLPAGIQGIHARDSLCLSGYLEGEDLAKVYASCDLFVFPSTTDTFGNVILEAQASGVPVIVSNAGGPRENIIPGSTGLVVEGDDVKSLHDAVRSLVCDPQRLRSMSKAARQYMQGRSFEQAFEKAWAMYREQGMESEWDLAKAV